MNKRSDIERVLEVWMTDGPTVIPDRIVDVVSTRIGIQRQRRTWPFPGRTTVNTQLKIMAGLAAALVVAVVGYNLLPGTSGPGAPTVAPTSTPTPTVVVTPAPTDSVVDLPDGTLAAGPYRIRPLYDDPDLGNLALVADVPAGWQGYRDLPALVSPGATNNDGVLIGFMKAETRFSDPCHWDLDGSGDRGQPGDIAVGPDASALVDALRTNPAYTYMRSEPYQIDGFQAWDLELQLPGKDVLASCDSAPDSGEGGDFLVFGGGFWAQGADNRWRLAIIEVDGSLLVALVSSFPGTSTADVAAGQAIVESFEITP